MTLREHIEGVLFVIGLMTFFVIWALVGQVLIALLFVFILVVGPLAFIYGFLSNVFHGKNDGE